MALGYGSTSSAVLPVYRDNPENARQFQREMYQKKLDATALEDERKNWQVPDIGKIDPIFRKPVLDAAADLSFYARKYLEKNPNGRGLSTDDGYVQKLQALQRVYQGEAIPGTEALKMRQQVRMNHPDAFVEESPEWEDAYRRGDSERLRQLNGGNLVIRPESNLKPNVDVNAVIRDLKKDAADDPKETVRPYKQRPGYDEYTITTNYNPEKGARWITEFLDSHPYARNIPGINETLAGAIAKPEVKTRIDPTPKSGDGNGLPSGWTDAVNQPKVVTISSNVATKGKGGEDMNTFHDAMGKTYSEVEKKTNAQGKTITVAKGTNTEVSPNKLDLEVEATEYYPLNGAKLQTSSDFVIDGTTGMQRKVSGSKRYELSGIGLLPYVEDKNGNAVIVSKTARPDPDKVKMAYFGEVLEDTGMLQGQYKNKPYLIKLNPDMIQAAEKAKIRLPDEIKRAATEGGKVTTKVTTPNATVTKTEEVKLSPTEWNKQWQSLKVGEIMIGLDGKTYTKK